MPSFANRRGIAHGGSNGQSIAVPDVCNTPSAGGPVPIPYPNVGRSSDASDGPKTVTIEGNMPMVKGATYRTSSGDEAGTAGGGVMSSSTQGACEFMMYSFDVRIEGRNACRLGDPLFHNRRNGAAGYEIGEAVLDAGVEATLLQVQDTQPVQEQQSRRPAITFIMGSGDGFYNAARRYWRERSRTDLLSGRTHVLVTELHTFTEVLAYLRSHPPPVPEGQQGPPQPWGEINIIVHANEEGSMAIPLDRDSGHYVTQQELQQSVDSGQTLPLSDTIVDAQTDVIIRGCALGRRPDMLRTLSQAFGGTDSAAPTVYGTIDLLAYEGQGRTYEQYLVEYWSVGFPSNAGWSNPDIVREFQRVHPTVLDIDWAQQVPTAHRSPERYSGRHTFTRLTIPSQTDRAGHQRLLATHPDTQRWSSWSVESQSTTPHGDTEDLEIVYSYQQLDDLGQSERGTYRVTRNMPVIPMTQAEQLSWLGRTRPDLVDRYSWRFELNNPNTPMGRTGTWILRYNGSRMIVRIERPLTDTQGQHLDPPHTETTHYRSFSPRSTSPLQP